MRFSPPARMNAVVKEEKEARLKAFIARHLASLQPAGSPEGTVTTYRLLALSTESPAARALAALAPELAAAGVAIEAVLARRSSEDATAALATADCRFVTDIRLLDAHEQLVLDAANVWIGDCMRRDPGRRDTYELYAACPVAAGHAVRSFAQIWGAAGPTGSWTTARRWTGPRPPSVFDPSLIAGAEAASAAVPFLRH